MDCSTKRRGLEGTMTPSQIELARKLVGHERWPKWKADKNSEMWWEERSACGMMVDERIYPLENLPDLTDDATAGVLLGMWREAEEFKHDETWSMLRTLSGKFAPRNQTTHMAELFAVMLLDVWAAQ